jgi:hypothetical protein
MSNYKFKTTNIKGKEYVQVNDRILFFRNEPKYNNWSLESEILSLEAESCVIRATIRNAEGSVVAQGLAQEDKSSSYINKTSFVENAETSAWGRALANLGIGIETSIASSQEVEMAIGKQELLTKKPITQETLDKMKAAISAGDVERVKAAISKFDISEAQIKYIGL